MWLRKQHWDNDLHQILPTHYQYLQYHICKYLLLIYIEILGMDISWFDSVSWIIRQLAHSLWASGHLRGDKGEGPGGNKITRFEVSGSFSKKHIMKIVCIFFNVLLNMIHTWVMIIGSSLSLQSGSCAIVWETPVSDGYPTRRGWNAECAPWSQLPPVHFNHINVHFRLR